MSEFGAQLKQARERRGISLRQIATSTKIAITALDALERDDFSRLPGGIFSRAFVRAYAIEVGLDPEKTVEQFLVQLSVAAAAESEPAAIEVSADDRAFLARQQRASRVLRLSVIVIIVFAIAGMFAWRLAVHARAQQGSVIVPPGNDSSDQRTPASTTADAATSPATPSPTTPAAVVAPAPAATPDRGSLVVELDPTSPCKTLVIVDGKVALDQTLVAGDHRHFAASQTFVLQVDDAGAMSWTINGKEARPMGPAGEGRTVRVSPETASAFVR